MWSPETCRALPGDLDVRPRRWRHSSKSGHSGCVDLLRLESCIDPSEKTRILAGLCRKDSRSKVWWQMCSWHGFQFHTRRHEFGRYVLYSVSFCLENPKPFWKSSWKVQKHCQVSMMQKCFMCVAYLWSDGPFRQAVSLLFEVCCEWSCHKFPSIESLEWPKPWVFAVRGWHPTHLYGDYKSWHKDSY